MKNHIIFFDTTLRDGDQASGFHFLNHEKIAMARQLAKLGVDVIEAGFAASSEGDEEVIRQISREIGRSGPVICSLSRTVDSDIEAAARAVSAATKPRIHIFIATSDIHIDGKFRKSRQWVLEKAAYAVQKACSYVSDVEFSCEDFGRSDSDYTVSVAREAVKAGAGTINLPDTVGWLTPSEMYCKLSYVIPKIRSERLDPIFSVHNHNDLGMATANTIEGIRAGAKQVEVTINGIGERAGNTALEEIAAILHSKQLGQSNIKREYIAETSRLCSKFTGVNPQPNKAVVGKNAFSHEAGIHQDGVIKDRHTYEILNPSEYGFESICTFGPRSGRNALRVKYTSLGINLPEQIFDCLYKRFKSYAEDKKVISDDDLMAIAKDCI
jgi:2-isopropylmalate synthase